MDAFSILDRLDKQPQPPLGGFDEAVAFIATPYSKKSLTLKIGMRQVI
jgi:hypothetical protein